MLKIGDKVTLHNGLKGTIIGITNGVEEFHDGNSLSSSMPRALYRIQCGASVFVYYTYQLDRNGVLCENRTNYR